VAHGISLSVGSVEALPEKYIRDTRKFMDETGIEIYSDHCAFHVLAGIDLKLFLCMPFIEESIDWLVARYEAVRDLLGMPFGLENVTYEFTPQSCALTELEFLNALLERTDCMLMLDVTNVLNNATNHGYDPVEFIRSLPGDRVHQMHLAGGHWQEGQLIDSHSYPVMDEAWELFDVALEHTNCEMVVLERDERFHPFSGVVADLEKAREIFYKHRPSAPPAVPAHPPRTCPIDENAAERLDPSDARYAGLLSYQRALMRELTDEDFKRRLAADPEVVAREFGLEGVWRERFESRVPKAIQRLSMIYRSIRRFEDQAEADYQRQQWAAWGQMA
jgi:uncharacterized protein (UPF0276 family)